MITLIKKRLTVMGSRWLSAFVSGLLLLSAQGVLAQSVTLNLKNADINALITTVAEVSGKNFIVDPRVKGKVTVISSKAMDSEEVYQVFLSILRVHGFSAVPSGEVIKIVPEVNAKQDSIPTVGSDSGGLGDQMVTRIVQVDNVPAAQLVPILRPLVPQQGHLAAYPTTNVLILSDRAANVERLVNIIKRIDQASDSEIELVAMEYASAVEVVRVLSALSRSSGGGGSRGKGKSAVAAGGLTMVADERTNSILLGGARAERLRLRALIAHLDTPLERNGNTSVIYLKYAQAPDLVKVLKGVGTAQNKVAGGKGGAVGGVASRSSSSRRTFDIQADESTNALVITAPQDVMRSLKEVIRKLDIRRAQVLVEAIIAEVSSDKAEELGVQWILDGRPRGTSPVAVSGFGSGSGQNIGQIGAAIAAGSAPSINDGLTLGLGRFNSSVMNFAMVLRALSGDSKTNILSTPTLMTLDNEEAEIVVGQNVPFLTGSYSGTSGVSSSVNPFQTIQRQDVGLTLKVKPQINAGNSIKLVIEQEVSSLSGGSTGADVITDKRSIKTSVIVDDGQMIILGGLMEDKLVEGEQRIPFLGAIPIVGELFKSRKTTKEKTNLMVFLHPVIMRTEADTARVTEDKYNFVRSQQLMYGKNGVSLMWGESPLVLPELEKKVTGSD
ncbi:MAG: type II secretion system secretin GspD [Gammaproteobacteria bacterium]|nr:type II secretion system secretin GspD [Gammaproteobacteria bacterium]